MRNWHRDELLLVSLIVRSVVSASITVWVGSGESDECEEDQAEDSL